ncbi:MAG: DUF4399 domain-containing protein [gamma proteobacterium symbiont of Taylorina sp.]|nr:DUF4399 domain-containing protein [gamma proteobacterium symbiont of Taylorina sp.]
MFRIFLTLFIFVASVNTVLAHGVAESSSTFIITPINNAIVTNPVTIKFGIKGFLIAPAGINKHKAGHYHLLLDAKKAISMDDPIPRDQQHIHFDQGETETTLKISPGKHILQLVVGDEEHEPFKELISKKIIIIVEKN